MTQIRYDSDADSTMLDGRRVAVLGFGSQGHAHAQNLSQSGVDVVVGLRPSSGSRARAIEAGLTVCDIPEAVTQSQIVMMLLPDTRQPRVFAEQVAPHLQAGDTLMFAHGFNIRYGTIEPAADIDVSMVAPKGPGHRVRETYLEGGGVPCLLAVHQNASGKADAVAMAYAKAIGGARAGVLTTTFAEETETDLFGEQAVLCGGASALVKAGFDTLVEAGYQPEVAYFECLHELKLIVDLMYRGGLNYMRYSVSDTAEYGDYTCGPKVIDDQVRARMREILADVQNGTFAQRWIAENEAGRPEFEATRQREADHPIERVGRELRDMMPFVDPVKVPRG